MEIFLLIVFIILIVISYCYWRFNKNSKWIDQQTLLPIQTFVEMADLLDPVYRRVAYNNLVFQAVHLLNNTYLPTKLSHYDIIKLNWNPIVFIKLLIVFYNVNNMNWDTGYYNYKQREEHEKILSLQSRMYVLTLMFEVIQKRGVICLYALAADLGKILESEADFLLEDLRRIFEEPVRSKFSNCI